MVAEQGAVYVIAGLLDPDNTYVAALDAKTGAVKWRNDSSGHLDPQRNTGIAGMGYPAIARGRLWLRSASYDLASGTCHPVMNPRMDRRTSATLPRYTGYFGDAFLVVGGSRFFNDQNISFTADNKSDAAYFIELNDDLTGKTPIAFPWNDCRVMPAWDERNLIAMPAAQNAKDPRPIARLVFRREEDLLCWDTPRAVAELRKNIAAAQVHRPLVSSYGEWVPKVPALIDHGKGEIYQDPQKVWCNQSGWYVAAVLTANAAVAAHALPAASGKAEDMTTYAVTAYDRTTGAQFWQATLPGHTRRNRLDVRRPCTGRNDWRCAAVRRGPPTVPVRGSTGWRE